MLSISSHFTYYSLRGFILCAVLDQLMRRSKGGVVSFVGMLVLFIGL